MFGVGISTYYILLWVHFVARFVVQYVFFLASYIGLISWFFAQLLSCFAISTVFLHIFHVWTFTIPRSRTLTFTITICDRNEVKVKMWLCWGSVLLVPYQPFQLDGMVAFSCFLISHSLRASSSYICCLVLLCVELHSLLRYGRDLVYFIFRS